MGKGQVDYLEHNVRLILDYELYDLVSKSKQPDSGEEGIEFESQEEL